MRSGLALPARRHPSARRMIGPAVLADYAAPGLLVARRCWRSASSSSCRSPSWAFVSTLARGPLRRPSIWTQHTVAAYVQFLFERDLMGPPLVVNTDYHATSSAARSPLAAITTVADPRRRLPRPALWMAFQPPHRRMPAGLPRHRGRSGPTSWCATTPWIPAAGATAASSTGTLIRFGITSQPLDVLYTPLATGIGLVYSFLPYMILPIYVSLEKLDRRLIESRLSTLRRQSLAGAAAGSSCRSPCRASSAAPSWSSCPGSALSSAPSCSGGAKSMMMMIGSLIQQQFGQSRKLAVRRRARAFRPAWRWSFWRFGLHALRYRRGEDAARIEARQGPLALPGSAPDRLMPPSCFSTLPIIVLVVPVVSGAGDFVAGALDRLQHAIGTSTSPNNGRHHPGDRQFADHRDPRATLAGTVIANDGGPWPTQARPLSRARAPSRPLLGLPLVVPDIVLGHRHPAVLRLVGIQSSVLMRRDPGAYRFSAHFRFRVILADPRPDHLQTGSTRRSRPTAGGGPLRQSLAMLTAASTLPLIWPGNSPPGRCWPSSARSADFVVKLFSWSGPGGDDLAGLRLRPWCGMGVTGPAVKRPWCRPSSSSAFDRAPHPVIPARARRFR